LSATFASADTKHDAIEKQINPPTVQILDLTHPLFGTTYPITTPMTPIGHDWIAIKMPSGHVRRVLRTATSLDQDALELEKLLLLPRLSVPLMLRLEKMLIMKKDSIEEQEHERGKQKRRPSTTISANHGGVAPVTSSKTRADRRRDGSHPGSVSKTSGDGGAK
jgi:hypothetical protein